MRSLFYLVVYGLVSGSTLVLATSCSAGQSGTNGQSPCTACSAGYYQSQSGASSCTAAQTGYYVSSTGQTAQTACPAGSYSSTTGSSSCTSCSAGTYQSQQGQSSCTKAQAGWYVSGTGSTSQTQCSQGSYSSTTGSTACTTCPAGSYCNGSGSTGPTLCPPGTYSSSTGTGQSCPNCPAGSFTGVSGSTSCCLCCSGFYNSNTGQTHCQACPNNSFSQQGYSQPGATGTDQCLAKAGALSTCSQSSDGTCPATGATTTTTTSASSTTTKPGGTVGMGRRSAKRSCPFGWKVCRSHGGQWSSDAQECVNINSDLESCGGCVADDSPDGEINSNGGRDCSAIPHVGSVRCLTGRCVIDRCLKGYDRSEDGEQCLSASTKSKNRKSAAGTSSYHQRRSQL